MSKFLMIDSTKKRNSFTTSNLCLTSAQTSCLEAAMLSIWKRSGEEMGKLRRLIRVRMSQDPFYKNVLIRLDIKADYSSLSKAYYANVQPNGLSALF